jgi:hypothetical protein
LHYRFDSLHITLEMHASMSKKTILVTNV